MHTAPFYVLIGANMPSVLAEIAFVSHPEEEKLLRTPEHRERIAGSLLEGVRAYLDALNRTRRRQLTGSRPRVYSGFGEAQPMIPAGAQPDRHLDQGREADLRPGGVVLRSLGLAGICARGRLRPRHRPRRRLHGPPPAPGPSWSEEISLPPGLPAVPAGLTPRPDRLDALRQLVDIYDAVRYIVPRAGHARRRPPRLIKRYDNRKLYDAGARRYVTIEDIARLVARRARTSRSQDQKTGDDITSWSWPRSSWTGSRSARPASPPGADAADPPGRAAGGGVGGMDRPQEAAARARAEAERIAAGLIAQGPPHARRGAGPAPGDRGLRAAPGGRRAARLESRFRGLLEGTGGPGQKLRTLEEKLDAFEQALAPRRAAAAAQARRPQEVVTSRA